MHNPIPKTPLHILARRSDAPQSPFSVQQPLADEHKVGETPSDEVDALAHLIYELYLQWNEQ